MLAARTWLVSSLPLAAMHIALREALKIGTQSIVSVVFWVVDFFFSPFYFCSFYFCGICPVPSDILGFLIKRCGRSGFPFSPKTQITVKLRGDQRHKTCYVLGKCFRGA